MTPSEENVIAGGVPNSVLRLSKELYNLKIDTEIITNDRKYREIGEVTNGFNFDHSGTNIFQIGFEYPSVMYSLDYLLKTAKSVRELKKTKNIGIIHGHSGHLQLSLVTEMAAKHSNIPGVHTVYCPSNSKNQFGKFAQFFTKTKKFIAISENVKKSLTNLGLDEEKIQVIHPLIDFNEYKPDIASRSEFDFVSDDNFVLMYLGNLTKTKQIDTIIEALNILKKSNHEFKFLSGLELSHSSTDQRIKEINKKIKNYNLEDNIIELGLTKNINKLMDISDIVIAPFDNTYEVADYPMTILEAMAVGTPVISTNVGGIPELIKNNHDGILVKPNQPKLLADKIVELKEDSGLIKRLGEKASRSIRKKLNTQRILQEHISLYEDLI